MPLVAPFDPFVADILIDVLGGLLCEKYVNEMGIKSIARLKQKTVK